MILLTSEFFQVEQVRRSFMVGWLLCGPLAITLYSPLSSAVQEHAPSEANFRAVAASCLKLQFASWQGQLAVDLVPRVPSLECKPSAALCFGGRCLAVKMQWLQAACFMPCQICLILSDLFNNCTSPSYVQGLRLATSTLLSAHI